MSATGVITMRVPPKLLLESCSSATRRTFALAAALAVTASSSRTHAMEGMNDGMMVSSVSKAAVFVDPSKAAAGTPNTYSTISAALAAAPAGGEVIVSSGMYNERLIINRPVTLFATTGAVLSWKSDKPYEAALDVDVSNAAEGSVRVSGLTIRHYSPSIAQNYAVYVHSPMRNVKFQNLDVASSSGSGIGVEGGNVTVFSCTIHDCKNHGVLYVGSGATGRVKRSVVEKCNLNGILLRDGASPTLSDNLIQGNGQYGAALVDCRGVLLNDNEVVRNRKGAVNGECDEMGG